MPTAQLDRLRFFADTPDLSGFQFPEAPPEAGVDVEEQTPTSRVQVAKVGKFKHPRYGVFSITRKTFEAMVANFTAGIPTDRLPVDFDHEPDYGGPSEACGWITGLSADGDALYATVEWLWRGAFAIREQTYRYVSPTWSLAYVDEAGEKRGPTLLAFGLTNRPYFTLPAVSLSQSFAREEFSVCEEVAETPAPEPSDSPARMADLADIAQVFGLDPEATEEQVLTAAQEAVKPEPPATFSTEQITELAEKQGLKVFAADQASELERNAKAGADAAEQLRVSRFEQAFDIALKDPKGARVAPAQKDELRKLYDASPDATLALIDTFTALVPGQSQGSGNPVAGEAPSNVDPESYDADREAKAYMAEHKVDYRTAAFAVEAQRQAV